MGSLSTLKGVFPIPKKPPKRDFLRENKQKVKEIQEIKRKSNTVDVKLNNGRNPRKTSSTSSLQPKKFIPDSCCALRKINCYKNNESSARSCDIAIQTDDISDMDYLTKALKRCTSRDCIGNLEQQAEQVDNSANINEIHQLNGNPLQKCNEDNLIENNLINLNINNNEYRESTLDNNHFNPETNCKLSNRDTPRKRAPVIRDIRLPKYLEKEKREKEKQKIEDGKRDPNCPPGHYTLPENERREALRAAEKEYQKLIDELNHMSITSQSFKVRARKAEIEKSLSKLDETKKKFSKYKVYIKIDS